MSEEKQKKEAAEKQPKKAASATKKKAAAKKPVAAKAAKAVKTTAKKVAAGKKAAPKKTATAKKPASTKKPVAAKKPVKAAKKKVEVPELELYNLSPPAGAVRSKKRLGLGEGSGYGRQSGRGHKGQKSRSGYSRKRGFEGGQMPLNRQIPKRGFTNIFRKAPESVNVFMLETLSSEKEITPETLLKNGLISHTRNGVKILGHGELKRALTVKANAFSKSAREKIEAAGGKAEVI